ncbi:MAG TPA: Nif3-like dinuclear metal center hexameric protein [Pirellulaceae bacterium]
MDFRDKLSGIGETMRVDDVRRFLEQVAPLTLAESWDNVGLLVGDPEAVVSRVMTCLTITPTSVEEAIERRCDLIVAHHPLPFRPLTRITTETTPGRLLLELIARRVSVYSSHTAFDSAAEGINQKLAELLGLRGIQPLRPCLGGPSELGGGRFGDAPPDFTLPRLAELLMARCGIPRLPYVGDAGSSISRIAVACGSAGEFLSAAHEADCDTFVTGETSLHTCLEAEALGMRLVLMGHYASERFAVEELAQRLALGFPALQVWASERERDPVRWLDGNGR